MSTVLAQVLADASVITTELHVSEDINSLTSVPGLTPRLAECLRENGYPVVTPLSELRASISEQAHLFDPVQACAARILVLYLEAQKRSHMLLQRSLSLSTAETQTQGPPVVEANKRRRVEQVPHSSGDEDGSDAEEDSQTFYSMLEKYANIDDEKQAQKADFAVSRELDEDIAQLCNDEPFDCEVNERTLAKRLKRIPWVPNFTASKPPRWPQVLSTIADDSYRVPAKRPDQDWTSYNRWKDAQKRQKKSLRIKEDVRKSTVQMLYANQLRLSAVIFQKTRYAIREYNDLLMSQQAVMSSEQAEQFKKTLKNAEDLDRLSKLSIEFQKSLLAKATKDRRHAFIRNSGDLAQVRQQIVSQKACPDGKNGWYMVDPAALGEDLQVQANLKRNIREATTSTRPFQQSYGYGANGRGNMGFRPNYGNSQGFRQHWYTNNQFNRPSYQTNYQAIPFQQNPAQLQIQYPAQPPAGRGRGRPEPPPPGLGQ